ncbi:putative Partitioning protein A [Vibrio nigripulchritudo SOn1]|uniref:Partitioning protein A n=1 Tax=Vibrio nigripulchritudo SOn1 TaxID=1238450 RepID=A0AAV2VHR6_9VIBR|nr:AAA family ATPase [Vibrio nigripulchritudo]CCO44177.1 putative Partitioning protein A [Vibrio nigripulchritudo SOn1]
MNRDETEAHFLALREAGRNYLATSKHSLNKSERTYRKGEVHDFFGIDPRTTKSYASRLGISDITELTLSQMRAIRNCLPDNLRVAPKFLRGDKRHCQVIAVQNQKGGVGKSTSSLNIASGLATEYHQDYRIGVIDLDAQHNASSFWVRDLSLDEHISAGELILGEYKLDEGETEKEFISSCFLQTQIENLRILPASQLHRSYEFKFHEQRMQGDPQAPYRRLKHIIDTVADEFDVIIIDTPPSSGFLTLNAYFAATSVIFPVCFNEIDVEATSSYFDFIPSLWKMMADLGHEGYDFCKVLVCNYDEHSSSELLIKNRFIEQFGYFTYGTEFIKSEAIRVCNNLNCTIFEMSASQYPKTKKSFNRCKQNVSQVLSGIHHDLVSSWERKLREV